MPRYKSSRIIENNIPFYYFLRKQRNINNSRHYSTALIYNPTAADRASIMTTTYTWSYGDRYYKLAGQYYGIPEYWWVIAWWNGRPTEASIQNGTVIQIPTNLEQALTLLGSY